MREPASRRERRRAASRRKRRRIAAALLMLALAAGTLAALYARAPENAPRANEPEQKEVARVPKPATDGIGVPEPAASTISNAAYEAVAPELASISPGSVGYARQSILDSSWASVRVKAPDRGGYYAVFLRREGKSWQPEISAIVSARTDPRYIEPLLQDVPRDLSGTLFSKPRSPDEGTAREQAVAVVKEATARDGWRSTTKKSSGPYHVVEVENKEDEDLRTKVYLSRQDGLWTVAAVGEELTSTEAPGFPKELVEQADPEPLPPADFGSSAAVVKGVEPEKVEEGLGAAREVVEGYSGIAGFYVRDLEGGFGYGVRPEEEFFAASLIKVPVMVAVFRRIEQGRLSLGDSLQITKEDKVPGSGGLEYEEVGTSQTVEDYLWLMITRSDNVAANVLVRAVGGKDYVNEVSGSLGATDTIMRQKITAERAAVPALDNQTTPEDMAEILAKIYTGKAASDDSCRQMVELMRHNEQEVWMEAGIPSNVQVANKGGWLDSTYNDAGIVEYRDRPYVLAIFTKYGENDIDAGGELLGEVSENVWETESSTGSDREDEKEDKEEK